jgi:hypothetical protein
MQLCVLDIVNPLYLPHAWSTSKLGNLLDLENKPSMVGPKINPIDPLKLI